MMKPSVVLLIPLYYIGNFIAFPLGAHLLADKIGLNIALLRSHSLFGWCLIGIGLLNSIYCYVVFMRKGNGTPMPTQPTFRIITDGPFAYTRNPLYIGQFLILFGEFLLFGTLPAGLYLMVFIAIYHFIVIPREEKINMQRFGESYSQYMSTVPRYILQ
ncbi:MAG: isoprenylcysteine carboxylmethyltransferase family protein [Candidatus Pacebacteria bacterium]|nr:isoprenylcysteine carboxylmethyltransferase family protein [Candidatus Paceibacterota bacterium]